MPGTTPTLGLPYAVDTDARAAGAGAIQDLAEATETELLERDATIAALTAVVDAAGDVAWAAASAPSSPVQALANGVAELAVFSALSGSGQITTADNETYTYTGPQRMFLVTAIAKIATTAGADGEQWQSKAELMVNGGTQVASEFAHSAAPSVATEDDFGGAHTHSLTWLALMNNGDTVALRLTSSLRASGGSATNKAISFVAMAPPS